MRPLTLAAALAVVAPLSAHATVVDGAASGSLLGATLDQEGVAVQTALRRDVPRRAFVLTGRSLQPLSAVTATVDGVALDVVLTGSRGFEVLVRTSAQARALLAGTPLRLHVQSTHDARWAQVVVAPSARLVPVTGAAIVAPWLAPIYARDAAPLRLRATLSTPTTVTSVAVVAPVGDPDVTDLSPSHWVVDWTLSEVGAALLHPAPPPALVTVDNGVLETQDLPLGLGVTHLQLTDDDPAVAWPAPTCAPAVEACIGHDPGGPDLAACGSYLEVATCVDARPCLLDGYGDVDLSDTDPSVLVPATTAWDAACFNGGTWCSQDDPTTWEVNLCLPGGTGLAAIWDEVSFLDRDLSGYGYGWGTVLTGRAAIAARFPFTATYSSDGPALLGAVMAYGGDDDGVQAWFGTSEIPCPNCHEWQDKTVLWWPATGRVVVLTTIHGYDS
ncbi:MAG: hypothetical protein H6733_06890 [Alphaproteobacteria bacterium]|nr:hypothetical protein [Alphaproteobacteria bacterium]